jgi:Holliday junction DNA helicase RuvB
MTRGRKPAPAPEAPREIAGTAGPDDLGEASLRPQRLEEFIGQRQVRANLRVFVDAARGRGEALDHVLFHGPPGLGKTTLAQIVARELGVGFRATSGPVIARAGDLAAILTNLQPRDVLFIDEIHRLAPAVEEILYPAMEDFQLDLVIGEGPAARSVRIDLPPFTLVAATTRAGLITTPLRDRFGIPLRLNFYEPDELEAIVRRGAGLLGLDAMDRRYLRCIAEIYGGGPVGIETLAAALSEQRDTLEDVIEPFLIQCGLVMRTPRGRVLGERGWRHLGLEPAPERLGQFDMLMRPGQAEDEDG